MEQRSLEWYEARLGKATASKFGDIMTLIKTGESAARKNYRSQLVAERLTGQPSDNFTSSAMQHGIDNEELARLEYSLMTGNDVKEAFFETHPTLQAGASPDGYVDTDGLVEIKCPNTATHIETLKTKKIPKQYYWQIMGQLWITGRKWCDYLSYDPRLPENAQLVLIRVERDEQAIKDLEIEIASFLRTVDEEVEFIKNYKEQL
jgi:putative phage-type endonuclease